MKLKLKIKPHRSSKKKIIIAWILKHSEFDDEIKELFQIFKEIIKITNFGF